MYQLLSFSVFHLQATTFQLILATNGMHTYAIIQFVSVELAAATRGDSARITGITGDPFDLPYANDKILQAPTLSNTGVQGKYVYYLNCEHHVQQCKDKIQLIFLIVFLYYTVFDPPPCPSCIERFKSVACQAIRFKHTSDGSNSIPRPCQE